MIDEPRHHTRHPDHKDRAHAERSPPSGQTRGNGVTRDQRGQDQPKDKKTAQRSGSTRARP